MEVSHTDLSEVTGMVLVEIGPVMMLTTGHTTTTWMLPVLADSSMTGGDVTAAIDGLLVYCEFEIDDGGAESALIIAPCRHTYCFRVLVARVGIVMDSTVQCYSSLVERTFEEFRAWEFGVCAKTRLTSAGSIITCKL